MTTGWCDGSGVGIHYESSGSGARTLVFIHELGGSLRSWDALAAVFGTRFRCLRYDQRGAGASEKVRAPFGVDDQVADLCALLDHLDLPPPYVLVSLAAGATTALAFASRAPRSVAALVLCAPATGVDPARREYLEARAEVAVRQGMRAIADATLARSYPPVATRDADVFRRYRARFLASDPVGYAHANRALVNFMLDDVIGTINMPCLLLAGAHDPLRPWTEVAALGRRLPHATLVGIDAGHLMAVQHPAAVAAAMEDFLGRHGLAEKPDRESEHEA
ncbi:alpha/beta fold hydrolase [Massilia putida]|uniref:alpha/beta fold hydrolase n=1 Tax=Massilia putida TaxID=1141883 RepID=UPI000950C0A9|nr:alpha/beta fold hydrolase [Massilia putida]